MNKKTKKVKNELENIKKEDMQLVEPKIKETKRYFYYGYSLRMLTFIVIFVICILLSLFFINKSIFIQDEKNIFYEEHGTPNYKVFLKNNDYYEKKYLDEGMSYIASIIDYISIDYNYNFKSDVLLNGEYSYKIVADLEIVNADNKSLFYTKKYDLLDEKKFEINNEKEYSIKEKVKIDYEHYNSLANNFKSSYGVDTESRLKVYMELSRKIDEDSGYNSKMNGTGKINLVIPLSEKAINIETETLKIENINFILTPSDYKVDDIKYLILSLLFLILAVASFFIMVKSIWTIQYKSSDYDKKLKKILKQYDRLIVNTNTMPDFENSNITKVDSFFELLDARDNLHRPIFYYEVTPHQKCYFFVKHDNDLILYTLKNID